MKSLLAVAFVVIVVAGAEDQGSRTFGSSQSVGVVSVGGHSAHHHDHQGHVAHAHELGHQHSQSAGIAVSSDAISVKTVPVFVGQVVNVRVVSKVPQVDGGSSIGTSGAISSLVETQQQVVGNIKAGLGTAVHNIVNPVVALLHNASVWLNQTSHNASFTNLQPVHAHDHAGHHGAVHEHVSQHAHHSHNLQPSVGAIPVLIINSQQVPTATVGSVIPQSLGLSPLASGQVLASGNSALGSQLFSFAAPAPVAALGDFLASAVAPIFGTAAPASTFQVAEMSSTVSTPNVTLTSDVINGTAAHPTVASAAPLGVVPTRVPSLRLSVSATTSPRLSVNSKSTNGTARGLM